MREDAPLFTVGPPVPRQDLEIENAPQSNAAPEPGPEPTTDSSHGRPGKGQAQVEDFLSILGGSDAEGTVEVTRMKPQGGQEYLYRIPVSDFDLEDVRRAWGGGKYRFIVRSPDGKYDFSRTVEIGGARKVPRAPKEREEEEEGSRVDLVIKSVEDLRESLEEFRRQVRSPPAAARDGNPIEMALALMTAFQAQQAPFLQALLNRTNEKPDFSEMLDVFFRGMETGQGQTPPPGSGYLPVIRDFGMPLLDAMRALKRQEDHPPPIAGPRANPPGEVAGVLPAPVQRPPWDMLLGPYVGQLQGWAAKGKNAAVMAHFVLEMIPEEAVPVLLDQLGRGEPFLEEFLTFHPECKPMAPWYRAFWGAIGEAFVWEEEDQDQERQEAPEDLEKRPASPEG